MDRHDFYAFSGDLLLKTFYFRPFCMYVCMYVCVSDHILEVCQHDILQTAGRNFTKFTIWYAKMS